MVEMRQDDTENWRTIAFIASEISADKTRRHLVECEGHMVNRTVLSQHSALNLRHPDRPGVSQSD